MHDSYQLGIIMTENQAEIIREAVLKERGRLWKFIRNRVSNDEDARDILQDVFFQLASNSGIVEGIENMAAWLFRVARNRIIDQYRKKKMENIDLQSASGDEEESYFEELASLVAEAPGNPDAIMERQLVWDAVYEALQELPDEQREVFILHELEDLSFREIAEKTGIPVNTLLSRKHYAVLYLREKLKDLYAEFRET